MTYASYEVSLVCGERSGENGTYFQSTGVESGACAASICPAANVCQLRLDFITFVISGPSTSTANAGGIVNGIPAQNGQGSGVTTATQCLTDSFSAATAASGVGRPPVICGINTGEHSGSSFYHSNHSDLVTVIEHVLL